MKSTIKDFLERNKKPMGIALRNLGLSILISAISVLILTVLPNFLLYYYNPIFLSKSEALTYYCTVLSSLVTIIGIYFTLKYNRKMMQEQVEKERGLSVLPYIGFYNNFSGSSIKIEGSRMVTRVFINRSNVDSYRFYVQEKMNTEDIDRYLNDIQNKFFCIAYMKNDGLGIAISLNIKIYNKDNLVGEVGKINIAPNQMLEVDFVFEDSNSNPKNFHILCSYDDIYNKHHSQRFIFANSKGKEDFEPDGESAFVDNLFWYIEEIKD